jgi:hypothetical protein
LQLAITERNQRLLALQDTIFPLLSSPYRGICQVEVAGSTRSVPDTAAPVDEDLRIATGPTLPPAEEVAQLL